MVKKYQNHKQICSTEHKIHFNLYFSLQPLNTNRSLRPGCPTSTPSTFPTSSHPPPPPLKTITATIHFVLRSHSAMRSKYMIISSLLNIIYIFIHCFPPPLLNTDRSAVGAGHHLGHRHQVHSRRVRFGARAPDPDWRLSVGRDRRERRDAALWTVQLPWQSQQHAGELLKDLKKEWSWDGSGDLGLIC